MSADRLTSRPIAAPKQARPRRTPRCRDCNTELTSGYRCAPCAARLLIVQYTACQRRTATTLYWSGVRWAARRTELAALAVPPRCWKCGGAMLANYDEASCLNCGAGETPPGPPPVMQCTDCGQRLAAHNTSGLCRHCARATIDDRPVPRSRDAYRADLHAARESGA